MRFFEFVTEAFDTKIPYKVLTATSDRFVTSAIVGNREIRYGADQDLYTGIWYISFVELSIPGSPRIGMTFGKSGSGKEFQVFSFVIDSTRELIERYKPSGLRFTSSKTDENRTTLYTRLLKRFPILGYTFVGVRTKGNDDQFIIKRNDMLEQELDEAPLPPDWDPKQYSPGTTFKDRLKYALDRAKKIGTGSSRVATDIEYEGRPTALKIAKNVKGLAQNEAEVKILDDGYVKSTGILIPLIDYDKQNPRPAWIQTEKAMKANDTNLEKLFGTPVYNIVDLADAIAGHSNWSPKDVEEYIRSDGASDRAVKNAYEYARKLADLRKNFNLLLGDLRRTANWGIFQGRPVVIDAGYTSEVRPLYRR